MHEAGVSVQGRIGVSEKEVRLADYPDHIVDWPGKKPRTAQSKQARRPAESLRMNRAERICASVAAGGVVFTTIHKFFPEDRWHDHHRGRGDQCGSPGLSAGLEIARCRDFGPGIKAERFMPISRKPAAMR